MASIEKDRGLRFLVGPQDAKVDIILIHGLKGDLRKTWTKDDVYWPDELLPEDCPEARILVYGYNSEVADFWERPANNNLDSFSNAFFQRLATERSASNATNRPIIFVAHSLGGLVVANAIVDATTNDYADLSACIRGIIFLGTPHKGSDLAKWGLIAEKFARYFSGYYTNSTLLPVLARPEHNEKVAKISTSFMSLLRKRGENKATRIEVMCFYEGQPTRLQKKNKNWFGEKLIGKAYELVDIGFVVDELSATLPGYEKVLIDADHSNMCKFSSREDPNYKHVAGQLAKWCKEFAYPVDLGGGKGVQKNAYFQGTNYGLQQYENSGQQTNNFGMPPQQPR